MNERKSKQFNRACDVLGDLMDAHPDPARFVGDVLDYHPDAADLAKVAEWLAAVARAESNTKS
jgi:hypothetical protein